VKTFSVSFGPAPLSHIEIPQKRASKPWCGSGEIYSRRGCFLRMIVSPFEMVIGLARSNNQENQIMSHIDRVFCSTQFDGIFPLAAIRALPRNPRDHAPIL
jgi:hypothetical protein